MPRYALLIVLAGLLLVGVIAAPATLACTGNCADHAEWPNINGKLKKANNGRPAHFRGGRRNDELLGHHGSDFLSGRGGSDVLWGDHDPNGQPVAKSRKHAYRFRNCEKVDYRSEKQRGGGLRPLP